MPDADLHPAVAAILAVTATDSDGLVVTEYYEDGGPHISQPAEVVAREQVIAVLRWLAANCPSNNEDGGTEDGLWFWTDLRDLADQIEATP